MSFIKYKGFWNILKLISISWVLIVVIRYGLTYFDIYLTNNYIDNIIIFLTINIWIIPIVYIFKLKDKFIKTLLSLLSTVIILFLSCFIIFLEIFTFSAVFSGNGYKLLYEQKLKNGKYFSVYRTTDLGAFGGAWEQYCEVSKLFPGLIIRKRIDRNSFRYETNSYYDMILYKRDTILLDKYINN